MGVDGPADVGVESVGRTDWAAWRVHVRRRWWFVLAQALVIALVVVAVLGIRDQSVHERTVHFVLHPASSLTEDQVAGAIDGLRPDGSVLQTVLHVLSSDALLQRVAADAKVGSVDRYSVGVAVQTGSSFYDVTVEGPNGRVVGTLADHMRTVAPADIEGLYKSYSLEVTGIDGSAHTAFPPGPDVIALALLLGLMLGVALTYAEWWLNEVRRAAAAKPTSEEPKLVAPRPLGVVLSRAISPGSTSVPPRTRSGHHSVGSPGTY